MNKIFLSLIHREQNKLIILLLSIFMILSFPQCIAMNSIPEQTGEYRIDWDDAIELLKSLLLNKKIEDIGDLEETINQTIDQKSKNKNKINTDEAALYKVIQYLLCKDKEKKILDSNDFLFLLNFGLNEINKNEIININIITEIIEDKGFLEYYKKDLSFADLIKKNLKKYSLDNQEFLSITFLLDDRYKEYLKYFILKSNNEKIDSSKEFMIQVLSCDESITMYCDAIGELYSNNKSCIKKHIISIMPFLLHDSIENTYKKSDRFKVIFDCLAANDYSPEKSLMTERQINNADIVSIITNYITYIMPNPEEFVNLIFFIEGKINDNEWDRVLTELNLKINNTKNSKIILEFLKELTHQNKKFSIFFYDLDDEDNIKNQYIQAFKKQENKLHRMKYCAMKEIEEITKKIEFDIETIEQNYQKQMYNLEFNYQKWKEQLCKEKNDDLDRLRNNENRISVQLIIVGRYLKKITPSSIKSQEDDLKKKIINEILGVSISCDDQEIKKIEVEPTIAISIEQAEDFEEVERNQFQALQEKYTDKVKTLIECVNKDQKKEYGEFDKSLKAFINDFDEEIKAVYNEKKKI